LGDPLLLKDGTTAAVALAATAIADWAGCASDASTELDEPANKYAEAGRPPSVSESPAFRA
jgi:hypothetical protein